MLFDLRQELPRHIHRLTTEQRRELWGRLRAGYFAGMPIGAAYGEELARLIESTLPELANQVRSEEGGHESKLNGFSAY